MPWSSAAERLSLLSIIAMVAALVSVFALARRLSGSAAAAAVAALALAFAPLAWRYGGLPEVFALHLALTLASLAAAFAAQQAPTQPRRSVGLALAALGFGLALSNHQTALLVLPVLIALAIATPGWRGRCGLLRAGGIVGGLVAGLAPYLYLLVARGDAIPRWGETRQWAGFVHHVLRRDYGTLQLALGEHAGPSSTILAFRAALPAQLGWPLLTAALCGSGLLLAEGLRRAAGAASGSTSRSRLVPLSFALAPLWAGPLFFLLFNVEAEGVGRQIVERFFLLPLALLTLPLAVAVAWLIRRCLGGGAGVSLGAAAAARRWRAPALAGALALLIGLRASAGLPAADLSESHAIEDYAINVLGVVARGALILGEGDDRLFALLHAQQVLRMRPDVQYVDVRMLLFPWYVAQQRRLFPHFDYRHQPGKVDSLGLLRRSLQAGRPVYLASIYSTAVRAAFGSYPVGPLQRLLPAGQAPPTLAALLARQQRLAGAALRRGRDPDPELDPWSARLREPWAWTWLTLARALNATDQPEAARRAHDAARAWAPWLLAPRPGPRRGLGTVPDARHRDRRPPARRVAAASHGFL
ncbi:MAG: DUF2723 domain-containing protein [Proteobacteria bacterium]|nr:DUF2723 domain-containing protein [Pseudomonadota bacterium]